MKGQRLDLLVQGALVVDIKSVSTLPEVAIAQTLSYLRATGLKEAALDQLWSANAQSRY